MNFEIEKVSNQRAVEVNTIENSMMNRTEEINTWMTKTHGFDLQQNIINQEFKTENTYALAQRFHTENIIWCGRQVNIIAITDKMTGKIVWKLGPDYDVSPELHEMGWIIGQHHAHMIPRGLPGEGNILVFDNGGWAGYGAPNPGSPTGYNNALRDFSRILENCTG